MRFVRPAAYAPLHKAVRGVQPIPAAKDKVTLRNCFPWDEAKLALTKRNLFSPPIFPLSLQPRPPHPSRFAFSFSPTHHHHSRPRSVRRFPRLYHFTLRSCPLPSVEMHADKRRRLLKGRKNPCIVTTYTVQIHRLFRHDRIFPASPFSLSLAIVEESLSFSSFGGKNSIVVRSGRVGKSRGKKLKLKSKAITWTITPYVALISSFPSFFFFFPVTRRHRAHAEND